MSHEKKLRKEIVEVGRLLERHEFVAGSDGNISARVDDDRILITPSGISKGAMDTRDLVLVDSEGRKFKGHRDASSEIAMHLFIYRMRPDVHAIVHAHPPTATGFAAAGLALDIPLVCEFVMGLGEIPLAAYGTPGTLELPETLKPFVSHCDAILLANHGAVTYGSDLQSAYMKMEKVEHFAKIALITHVLGRRHLLTPEEVERLVKRRGNGTSALHHSLVRSLASV